MSSPQEDHREKNIMLAKNLNQVKMDLRSKKKDLLELRSKLRMEKQRNTKLESDQVSILQRIDFLKQQLDDTFLKNTVGYIHLSKQLDQMHQDSVQSLNTSMESNATIPGESNATFSLNSTAAPPTFLAKIKAIGESMATNSNGGASECAAGPSNATLNSSIVSNGRESLSFSTFSLGLTSTYVQQRTKADDDGESVMNCTFLEDSSENRNETTSSNSETATPLSEINENRLNVTVRRTRNKSRYEKSSRLAKKIVQNQMSNGTENRPMATDLGKTAASDVLHRLRSGCRPLKKIDYNESIRRKK